MSKLKLIPITTPLRKFKGHEERIMAVAVFLNKRRMVTGSIDKTLRLWDLKTGVVLKKMEGHSGEVLGLAVSQDEQLIASGDFNGEVIVWHGETGESLTQPIKVHSSCVSSLDFSPDGTVLVTGSGAKLCWKSQITCSCWVQRTVFAISTRKRASHPSRVMTHTLYNCSLAWIPDGAHLLSGSNDFNTLRKWGHIAVNPAGTLVASASDDNYVRLWQRSDRQTIAIFKHSSSPTCITFSVDGKHILNGGGHEIINLGVARACFVQILAITTARIAIINGDLSTAEELLAQEINTGTDDHTSYVRRSFVMSRKHDWDHTLQDAINVTELNPSSHVGYQSTYTALHAAQRYDEAVKAFTIMLSKLDSAPEAQIRNLRQQYVSPSEAEDTIRKAVWIELENAPLRLLNTSTGLLCNRAAQINSFKMSSEYKELLSSTTKHSDLQTNRIKDVVATYFRCVLLSHSWEETEVLLHDIQDKVVYELNGLGGIAKLQSFCKIVRDAGYNWAWMDTCCIDKNSNPEVQESINSMFVWYRHSALTIVYLCDVPPSSQPGALAQSVWNERAWTFQELVAPKVVIFYQKDWSLYLNDRSPNHKESPAIMKELEGMSDARQRLQWASSRITTLQEDIAYSLFGIFDVHLPVMYRENKQNALGRLLQEIVARSGDITVLDWVGQASEFNSCLPAYITSYTTPPLTLPSLSEDQIQTTISSLRKNPMALDLASKLHDALDYMSAARFVSYRLHLPCITFRVTEVSLSYGPSETQYQVKADGLHDLLITTNEPLVQSSQTRPPHQTFVLVRPWDRSLIELSDFADLLDDTESEEDYWTPPPSPSDDSSSRSLVEQVDGSKSRALRLLVHLGQPFRAFLLARQRRGEYKRVASDRDIIAQVKDVASVRYLMGIRMMEIS
ncbi:uncharacterized protein HD556DRAFT_1525346 [Suillus plorans]|uniref:Heterokaryon incompatibility domain-containing protein n=1 Tax=Suillus plorans TaxID=116603 RepID=A0A9P7J1U2_9AGAM|nr:uncharacterized protein HD556DRAFT_1525346 [Suillus plorans]KAG1799483.1 hypothetical protein HD556DRAFT_1525346 [Suillus plorans]